MDPVRLALVGCGGIAGAHVRALATLWEKGARPFEVVATCDRVEERARERAAEVAKFQGREPAVYADLGGLLNAQTELEAVSICALHSEHHTLAVPCLEAGRDVIIEKPLAITMRAGRQIVEAAVNSRRLLAVAENYRRSPAERAHNWAIRLGRIGTPRTFYWQDVSEGLGTWGGRNFRMEAGAGWVLDGGVHFADLFRYHLRSSATEVFARVRQYEPYRYDAPEGRTGGWRVDVEDAVLALVSFADDVLVQWTWQGSAPGQGFNRRAIYGSEGCIDWATGLWRRGGTHLETEALVEEYMASLSAEEKEVLFPAGVTDPIAVELVDFARAVRGGAACEVDGMEGYRAQAICMAIFESAWLNRPVNLLEIERCETEAYQAAINDKLGLA